MSNSRFYTSQTYRELQSTRSREAWQKRFRSFKHKCEHRSCLRPTCAHTFVVSPSDPKKYCSQKCAAIVTNHARKHSSETKRKIAHSLRGRTSPYKGTIRVPRIAFLCRNTLCGKTFYAERWKKREYCSNACLMQVVGKRPTSPKASGGKAGIREDVSPSIYFHSRWEANIARLYNHLGIAWKYESATFDIGEQNYTPDFYLPESKTYVEVKNFWWKYSKNRDRKFRRKYPDLFLQVLLKDEYLKLEKQYAHQIPHWEYRNSAPPANHKKVPSSSLGDDS